MLKFLTSFSIMAVCLADLRKACQPRNQWKVKQRNRNVKFVSSDNDCLYMEPSDFGYQGLKNQRDGGGYDNFLRSNIDNEQDKRNFVAELGMDHLPFRSWQGEAHDDHQSHKTKIPEGAPGPVLTVTPGEKQTTPLRWNNPHSSELEVNIWIMNMDGDKPVVVPIRKPTCSGEGHQDNVYTFTVPTDFNQLGKRIPKFKGCKTRGECVLQVYAHSVESRTYASGVPLIVTGDVPKAIATVLNVPAAQKDVALDLDQLPRDICLSSAQTSADIVNAVPRMARLISDVYNHAFQNSDFSPYSGQQPEAISRNMQASCILKMVTGNRGELGKATFNQNKERKNFRKQIEKKAKELVRFYESIANQIIGAIQPHMENSAQMTLTPGSGETQNTATCFRCAEVGAINSRRLTTNTYVPSFQIPDKTVSTPQGLIGQIVGGTTLGPQIKLVDLARAYIPPVYSHIIDESRQLLIYTTVLDDMSGLFTKAAADYNINYLGPQIKDSVQTMASATQFRKIDASGKYDNGYYATAEAKKVRNSEASGFTGRISGLEGSHLLSTDADETFNTALGSDMDGLNYDGPCDDDASVDIDAADDVDAADDACQVKGYFTGQQWFVEEDADLKSDAAAHRVWSIVTMGAILLTTVVIQF